MKIGLQIPRFNWLGSHKNTDSELVEIAPDTQTLTEIMQLCQELTEIGFYRIIFNMPNEHEIEPRRRIGRGFIPFIAKFEPD